VRLADGTDAIAAVPNRGEALPPWKTGDPAVLTWDARDAAVLED
jgi:hypothetical protein